MSVAETIDREVLIASWSSKILHKLKAVLPAKPVEAGLRHAIEPLLDDFCEAVGVNALPEVEYTLASGRADAIFNRLIIEYKKPGVLKKSSDRATRDAVSQATGYVKDIAQKQRQKLTRMAAVVFDGEHIIFVRYINEKWVEEPPAEVNQHSLERFLTWLSGLSSGIALTAENLNRDFAVEQLRTQVILRALYHGLSRALSGPENIVTKLFEQWRLFFGESIDYSEAFGGRKLEPLRNWVRKAGIEVKTAEEAERFFFSLHTYFALLTKLLAWLALSRHMAVKIGAPSFSELAMLDSDSLKERLQEMESGGIFRLYGIANLLEGDFFAWYPHIWNGQIEDAVREILKRLDEYDPTTLSVVPEETRDLFKKLYHYLLPREVRHNLGEYYTPDWLAQRVLNQVDYEFFTADPNGRAGSALRRKLLSLRFLDPACGSGTFPILVIARMRELGDALMINESQLLEAILRNVVGFDLNPLAVLTARVNYLLAITELLEHRKGEITVPIYLADSVRSPSEGSNLWASGAYEFPTAVGKFLVPSPLCTRERFDRFCALLAEAVHSGPPEDVFTARVCARLGITSQEWDEQSEDRLRALYRRLVDLHSQGLDGLWARLLENNFAPLTVGQFDYIVGNPPWVNWESLPDGYRDEIKPIWQRYGLFPHGGMATILGKGKKEIATLMTLVVVDHLLKDRGRLGFVITQAVFKTSGAAQGFRRFLIPKGERSSVALRVVHVDDMVDLNPFEGASNRTAILVLERGRPTTYPVSYTVWRKGQGARFNYDSTLRDVQSATSTHHFDAAPINENDPTSAWLTGRPKVLKSLRKVLSASPYRAYAGSYTGGANGIYWLDRVLVRPDGLTVVRNITEGAKVKVASVTDTVETDLLYPLLRGRDVKRWTALPSAHVLMVQDPVLRRGISLTEMQAQYTHALRYLAKSESILRERAAFKRYFTRKDKSGRVVETGQFYSMFNIGDYSFNPWKVVWREQASAMTASVVGEVEGKPILPDHKLMLVPCSNVQEAHYVCSLLNSAITRLVVVSYAISIQMDPHILDNVGIPYFDPSNPVHARLADLSAAAHVAAKTGDSSRLDGIETEVDREAAKVWGVTDEDLKEIWRNLDEVPSAFERTAGANGVREDEGT